MTCRAPGNKRSRLTQCCLSQDPVPISDAQAEWLAPQQLQARRQAIARLWDVSNKSARPEPQRLVSADEQQGSLQLDRASSQPLPDSLATSSPRHAGYHSAPPVKALAVAGVSKEADRALPAVRRRSAAAAFSEDSGGFPSHWPKSKQLRLSSEFDGHHGTSSRSPQASARSASLCGSTLQQRPKPSRQQRMSWPPDNVQLPLPMHALGRNDQVSMPPQSTSGIADAFSLHLHQMSCEPQQTPLPPTRSHPQIQNDHQHSQPQQKWQHQPPQFLPLWECPQADSLPSMQDLSCVGGSDVLEEAALMFAADAAGSNEGDTICSDPLSLDQGAGSNVCSMGSMSPPEVSKCCGIPVCLDMMSSIRAQQSAVSDCYYFICNDCVISGFCRCLRSHGVIATLPAPFV